MANTQFIKLFLGVLVAGTVGCTSLQACQTAQCSADEQITAAVHQRIEHSPTSFGLIHVSTENGIVYLHGGVSTSVEAAAIEELAHVPGAKDVVNDLNLSP